MALKTCDSCKCKTCTSYLDCDNMPIGCDACHEWELTNPIIGSYQRISPTLHRSTCEDYRRAV